MSATATIVAFILMALAVLTILTIGTLTAAGMIHRRAARPTLTNGRVHDLTTRPGHPGDDVSDAA